MQLLTGRTAQEYNQRKGRKGAYWEDRYHATAVDTEAYLVRCLVYIDLNMVRAGAVSHPGHWADSGYCELMMPPKRYAIIDFRELQHLLGLTTLAQLQETRARSVAGALTSGRREREAAWSESLAVGREAFVEYVQARLGVRATHRDVVASGEAYSLRESAVTYRVNYGE